MRWLFVILLSGFVWPVQAAWVLNSSPALVDTGIDIKVSEQKYLNFLYTVPDGAHALFGFSAGSTNYQIWDVNLSNYVSRVVTLTKGLPNIGALTSSNMLVMASGDDSWICQYDPQTGTTNFVKEASDSTCYSSVIGTDGHVYFNTHPNAKVEEFNPADNTCKEWGKLDEALSGSAYGYSVGGDSNYIYGAIREATGAQNWYFAVIRKSDTNKTVYWKTGVSANITIKGHTNGTWYVAQSTNSVEKYFILTNGAPEFVSGTPTGFVPTHRRSGVNTSKGAWSTEDGWDIEVALDVSSASGSASTATMGIKRTNEVDYVAVVETNGWLVLPGNTAIVQPWSGTNLLWATSAYGPIGSFVPGGLTTILGQYKGISAYDVFQVSESEIYIGGYHKSTLRWDTTQPWTRVPLMADYTSTNVNPFTSVSGLGKYHYYLTKGNDGKIYIGSHHRLDATGGELGWYNPSNNTSGSERTTFLDYNVMDLKTAESGSKLVYVSATPTVFIWDVATFTQVTNFVVLTDVELDKVVEYESGKMMGVSDTITVGFSTSGMVLWTNSLPASAWGGSGTPMTEERHRLTLGPDNFVWLCAGGILRRINPVDGSYSNILTTTLNYNTVFDGMDCYLYGRTLVMKISNLLTNTGSASSARINAGTVNVGKVVLTP